MIGRSYVFYRNPGKDKLEYVAATAEQENRVMNKLVDDGKNLVDVIPLSEDGKLIREPGDREAELIAMLIKSEVEENISEIVVSAEVEGEMTGLEEITLSEDGIALEENEPQIELLPPGYDPLADRKFVTKPTAAELTATDIKDREEPENVVLETVKAEDPDLEIEFNEEAALGMAAPGESVTAKSPPMSWDNIKGIMDEEDPNPPKQARQETKDPVFLEGVKFIDSPTGTRPWEDVSRR